MPKKIVKDLSSLANVLRDKEEAKILEAKRKFDASKEKKKKIYPSKKPVVAPVAVAPVKEVEVKVEVKIIEPVQKLFQVARTVYSKGKAKKVAEFIIATSPEEAKEIFPKDKKNERLISGASKVVFLRTKEIAGDPVTTLKAIRTLNKIQTNPSAAKVMAFHNNKR